MRYLVIGLLLSIGWQLGDMLITIIVRTITMSIRVMAKEPDGPMWCKKLVGENEVKSEVKNTIGFKY